MTENEEEVLKKKRKYDDHSYSIPEIQDISSEAIKKLFDNQNKLMEKLKEMEKEREPIKIEIPPIDTRSNQQKTLSSISMSPRQFILKHVFKDVSKMVDGGRLFSSSEEHCGVLFYIDIRHIKENVAIYLVTDRKENLETPWSIGTASQFKVINSNGEPLCKEATYVYKDYSARGVPDFLKFEDAKKNYLVDGKFSVEVHVTINKMTGIYPKNLRNFDKSNEELSDVILIIGDAKFYVSKLTLASYSPYFKALFLGQFHEKSKAEITLNGIDSDDFQKYLEVVYGESAINEYTVEGILHIADMYDTPIVIRKCEKFLLKEPRKNPKKKLEMAARYNLNDLKKKILDRINNADDIAELLPGDINDMEKSIMASLLEIVSRW